MLHFGEFDVLSSAIGRFCRFLRIPVDQISESVLVPCLSAGTNNSKTTLRHKGAGMIAPSASGSAISAIDQAGQGISIFECRHPFLGKVSRVRPWSSRQHCKPNHRQCCSQAGNRAITESFQNRICFPGKISVRDPAMQNVDPVEGS